MSNDDPRLTVSPVEDWLESPIADDEIDCFATGEIAPASKLHFDS